MASRNEIMQRIWRRYESGREHKPSSARQAVEWAVKEGLLVEPEVDPYDILADQMCQAIREEHKTDEQGRRYRINHAVRVTRHGVQLTFWGVMGHAPHDHMEKAFAQRRELIIGDNVQLKTDVDVYNEKYRGKNPAIQLILDYTDDVAEREELRKMRNRRDAA
jgi:hypothetical protein